MSNRLKSWLVNFATVLILYTNIWGMLEVWQIRFDPQIFPQTPFVSNLFYIYGVFKEVHLQNRAYAALGSYRDNMVAQPEYMRDMVDLKLYEYFPQSHGEANQRISFAGINNQKQRIEVEYKRMAALIKRDYNLNHPKRPIKHVYILMYYWPADQRGYYARMKESSTILLACD